MKDLENELSNKGVAAKYDVPWNTISTWVKNKQKLTASLEKRNSSRQNTRCWNFGKVDKAKFTTGLSEKEAKKYL